VEEDLLVDARASEAPRHLLPLLVVRLLQRWVNRILHTLDIAPTRPAAAGNLSLGVAEVPVLRRAGGGGAARGPQGEHGHLPFPRVPPRSRLAFHYARARVTAARAPWGVGGCGE